MAILSAWYCPSKFSHSSEMVTKIIGKYLDRLRRDRLTVLFFGKTGVGKSSTLNALFGVNWATDDAVACTKKPQFVDLDASQYGNFPYQQIRIVDLPGIGESLTDDKNYMAYYKKWIPKADCLVWVTQADTRAYKRDEMFLKKLKPLFKPSLFLIVALNKIDYLAVYEGEKQFNIEKREPSEDQLRLIPEKIDDVYGIFQRAVDGKITFDKNQILPYTSFYGWGLDNLKRQILAKTKLTRSPLKIMLDKILSLFPPQTPKTPLRLVIGLNQVDKMIPNGWDERLNTPTKEAKEQIKRRCNDIIKKLSQKTEISEANIEYYSASKRYNLIPLLTKIIQNAYAGFKLDNVKPADPFELADAEVKAFADKERRKMANSVEEKVDSQSKTLDEIKKIIPEANLKLIMDKIQQETKLPPKVAVIGKSGVGKTTTINNLFNAELKTSPTTVGTTKPQIKEFTLSTGGALTVVDLPGYGRSEAEDQEYEKKYQDLIPSCDLVLLILQADTRDFADDIEMINKITKWLKNHPVPKR
ncbi:GTPase [Limnoraphis robusta Tam1]|uniref:GTPase family protein n=1 Tax=Limnoraphis robusta TaxID=1118279 RepID=UPI002B21F46C|nr:GTPase [Limnoraphis robusta]MEA5500017.1 GTPase [Limnoraphis robusta BA-68 BA1]MEA5539630.1 GTPase [Limnoraphis robusta Tam1]